MSEQHDFYGHRDRIKQQALEKGFSSLKDYELLEFLLFYSIPRRDTQPIARELIKSFGSVRGVLEASVDALTNVVGIGESTALLIKLSSALIKKYLSDSIENTIISNDRQAAEYFLPYFIGEANELVYAVFLDSKNKLIKCEKISQGGLQSAEANLRAVVAAAVNTNSASVILAHNHPDGDGHPSAEDLELTKKISAVLKGINIELFDHIIWGKEDYFSLRSVGEYSILF